MIVPTEPFESFSRACAARGPLRLRIEHSTDQHAIVRTYAQPVLLAGMDWRNDLPLVGEGVSKRHVYLQVFCGQVYFVDLDSKSGTSLGDGPCKAGWLTAGQALQVGPFRLRVLEESVGAFAPGPDNYDPRQSPGQPNPPLPRVSLEFVSRGAKKGMSWPMESALAFLGNTASCHIRLPAPSASRFHCSLVRTPTGLWAFDLFGKDGVRVNGEQVRLARLEHGDEIRIGRFAFRVHTTLPLPALRPPDGIPVVANWPSADARFAQPSGANSALPGPAWPAALVSASPTSTRDHEAYPPIPGNGAGLVQVVGQFRLLHQDMLTQFQQTLLGMTSSLSNMQAEQFAFVREELVRLTNLGAELAEARRELALVRRARVKKKSGNRPQSPSKAKPRRGLGEEAKQLPGPDGRDLAGTTEWTDASVARVNSAGKPRSSAKRSFAESGSEVDLHAYLTHRIASIQREQETGWQRLFGFFGSTNSR
jgi:pSer/pThr/pTyr-binding forkhead associated (FHA) protein